MSLTRVLNGIGKGSLFGYGRVCGVQTPFSPKATSDPFVNVIFTLARYSHCGTRDQKNQVRENIAARMKEPLTQDEVADIFKHIDVEVLMSTLARHTFDDYYVHQAIYSMLCLRKKSLIPHLCLYRKMLANLAAYSDKSQYKYGNEPAYANSYLAKHAFIELESIGIKPEEIDKIAQSTTSDGMLKTIIRCKGTPRQTLIWMVNREVKNGDDSVNVEAFERLKDSLTLDEMLSLTDSPTFTVLKELLTHPQATLTVKAKIAIRINPNTGIVRTDNRE